MQLVIKQMHCGRGRIFAVLGLALLAAYPRTGVAQQSPDEDSVQTCLLGDCNCPGCQSYREACGLPPICDELGAGVGNEGEYVPAPAPLAENDPSADPLPDLEAAPSTDETMSGAMPAMSASFGATAMAMSASPQMIGDLFGVGSGSSEIFAARLFVAGHDFLPGMQSSGDDPLTAISGSSAVIAGGVDPLTGVLIPPGIVGFIDPPVEFTTAVSLNAMTATLTTDPDAQIPITNNPDYEAAVEDEFVARNGEGGDTQFNAAGSYATLEDGQIPSDGLGTTESYNAIYQYDYLILAPFETVGGLPGANVGRQKATENGSPIPRDRIIDNFSFFKNTPLQSRGQDVTRNVVGFEKTFFDSMTSFELRAPYAATLNNIQTLAADGAVGGTNGEFGNLTLYAKLLLFENRRWAIGTGLGIALPTADDFVLQDGSGSQVLRVENQAAHLMPYLGFVATPNAELFVQGIIQWDVDPHGNAVSLSPFENGAYTGQLEYIDQFHDKDLMYIDLAVGYWLYRDSGARWLTGFAPVAEIHENTSIDRGDQLVTDDFRTVGSSSFDLVNAVFGTVLQFRGNTNVTLAYATPLGGDEQFDGEFRLNLNWFFGASAQRAARFGF